MSSSSDYIQNDISIITSFSTDTRSTVFLRKWRKTVTQYQGHLDLSNALLLVPGEVVEVRVVILLSAGLLQVHVWYVEESTLLGILMQFGRQETASVRTRLKPSSAVSSIAWATDIRNCLLSKTPLSKNTIRDYIWPKERKDKFF